MKYQAICLSFVNFIVYSSKVLAKESVLNYQSPDWISDNYTLDHDIVWSGDLINLGLEYSLNEFKVRYNKLYPKKNARNSISNLKNGKTGFYLEKPAAITRPFKCSKGKICTIELTWSNKAWSHKFHPFYRNLDNGPGTVYFHFDGKDSYFLWRRDLSWGILEPEYVIQMTLGTKERVAHPSFKTVPLSFKAGPRLSIFGTAPGN